MTQYLVPQEGSFIEEGYLNEMGLIENMAQSSFIFLSYLKNQQEALLPDQGNAIGYISSILSLEVTKRPQVGQLLQTQLMTELVFSSEFLKICKITGDIRVGENLIFKATMNMLLQSQAE